MGSSHNFFFEQIEHQHRQNELHRMVDAALQKEFEESRDLVETACWDLPNQHFQAQLVNGIYVSYKTGFTQMDRHTSMSHLFDRIRRDYKVADECKNKIQEYMNALAEATGNVRLTMGVFKMDCREEFLGLDYLLECSETDQVVFDFYCNLTQVKLLEIKMTKDLKDRFYENYVSKLFQKSPNIYNYHQPEPLLEFLYPRIISAEFAKRTIQESEGLKSLLRLIRD